MSHINLPVAVHVILIKDGQILLIHRKNTGYNDGQWSLPAGRLESGESMTQGARREAREEVGAIIESDKFAATLVMHHHDSRGERLYIFFLCQQWKGNIKNCEPDKCDQILWFKINKLPETLIPHVRTAVESILHGDSFLQFGF